MKKIKIEVKKDRIEINKIIENCLPLIKLNKAMTQECADAIIVYFIDKAERPYTKGKKAIKRLRSRN